MYYSYEITTTQQCNMACTYCFEGEELKDKTKQLNEKDIIRSVYDMLNDKEFMKDYTGITLNMWGGESTLNKEMIINLIQEFANYNIDFFFYTNGYNALDIATIIYKSKELLDNYEKRLRFQISFDGMNNDLERVDHAGNGTSKRILKNIDYFKKEFPEIAFTLKSTLMINELYNLVDHWYYWKDLIEKYPEFSWSPTLEYTQQYDISKEQLDKITDQFLKIAKLDIQYYKNNSRYVWGWFEHKDKSLCSAGINISNVDLEGNVTMCHGALYSTKKDDLILGNIKDTNIIQKIKTNKYYTQEIFTMSDHCKNCVATVCYQCPTVNHELNGKFYEPKVDLCDVYQSFGKISRTVQKYLTKG